MIIDGLSVNLQISNLLLPIGAHSLVNTLPVSSVFIQNNEKYKWLQLLALDLKLILYSSEMLLVITCKHWSFKAFRIANLLPIAILPRGTAMYNANFYTISSVAFIKTKLVWKFLTIGMHHTLYITDSSVLCFPNGPLSGVSWMMIHLKCFKMLISYIARINSCNLV